MKAIVLEKVGGVENLTVKEVDKPAIKSNEVLIENKAISVNPVDFKVRAIDGLIEMIYGKETPVILGWDIAGIVKHVGSKVSGFKIGDRVFGMVNFIGAGKGYAEYVASPADHLAKIPDNTSFEEAAATTLAALTALQAIEGRVKEGDKVLIHAGSGGVGHFAIQIAKHFGAYVMATSSAKNKDFVMSLGADEHIDYRNQAFEEVLSDIDFVLDGVSGEVLMNSVKVLRDGGTIVTLTSPPEIIDEAQKAAGEKRITVTPLKVQSSGKDMNTLKDLLAGSSIKAHVSKTFSFDKMGQAHTELESGRTVGKLVIQL